MRKSFVTIVGAAVAAALVLGGQSAQAASQFEGLPMTVHKSPLCGCCGEYIAILRQRGAEVTVIDTEDTASVKQGLGVPMSAWSCHTTVVAGYAVEGHLPIEAIEHLLDERPDVGGIALPGMPAGSPGMTGMKTSPFEVVAFEAHGVRHFGDY
ncbi:MAG TPA: DUF411 domain-containing protein [Trueperaceae bacterium]|nr:DUF411 domain-containing protein [Trueperaceae bacterium]